MSSNKEIMKDSLEALKYVKKVEVSPFLLTRIKSKLEQLEETISKPAAWSLASFTVLLLLITLTIGVKKIKADTSTNLVDEMELMTNNNLYHE